MELVLIHVVFYLSGTYFNLKANLPRNNFLYDSVWLSLNYN